VSGQENVVIGTCPGSGANLHHLSDPGGKRGSHVIFDANASTTPAGTTLTDFTWDFGDGTTADGPAAEHTFSEPGRYAIALTVMNSVGLKVCARRLIDVTPFRRGDCNSDAAIDISDAVCTLEWLFLGKEEPGCVPATNVNGDAGVDISDPVSLLGFLFQGGTAPVFPYPDCGIGLLEADEPLGCKTATKGCE